jgi:tetratricopeptide (TPR) repeat protein
LPRTHRTARHVPGLRAAVIVVVGVLALWPLFAEGLYADWGQFVGFWQATVAVALVFALGLSEKTPLRVTPSRLATAVLWLLYVASLFVAVAPRQAVQEIVKFGLYSLVFLTVSETTRSGESARLAAAERAPVPSEIPGASGVMLALWASCAVMALASLVAAVGLLPYEVVTGGRLYTFLHYPNSAGSLAGAAFLVGLGLRRRLLARCLGGRILYDVSQWVLLVTFILTMSRGAFLVLPVAFGVTLLVWPPRQRFEALGDLALTGLAAGAVAPFLARFFGQPAPGVALLGGGLVLALGLGWLGRRYSALPPRRQLGFLAMLVVALVVGGALLLSTGALPTTLAARLRGFNLAETSAAERIIWSRDALAVIVDHPFLGVGGGGWASVYYQYQGYPYIAREVHNDFLEIGVETGLPGLATFLALLGSGAWAVWRVARRGGRDERLAALAGAGTMLALHSAIDFNLALAAVGIHLWAILGALDGIELGARGEPRPAGREGRPGRREASHKPTLVARLGILAVALAVSILGVSLLGGFLAAFNAARLGAQMRLETSHAAFLRAVSLDPWSPEFRLKHAVTCERLFEATGEPEYITEARAEAERAIALDPRNPAGHAYYATLGLGYGPYDEAESHLRTAAALHPFDPERYEQMASFYLTLGRAYLAKGELALAREKLEKSFAILGLLEEQAAKTPPDTPKGRALPSVTPPVALYAGQAALLLGDGDEATRLLLYAREAGACVIAGESGQTVRDRKAQASLWLALVAETRGDAAGRARYLKEARATLPEAESELQTLRTLVGLLPR